MAAVGRRLTLDGYLRKRVAGDVEALLDAIYSRSVFVESFWEFIVPNKKSLGGTTLIEKLVGYKFDGAVLEDKEVYFVGSFYPTKLGMECCRNIKAEDDVWYIIDNKDDRGKIIEAADSFYDRYRVEMIREETILLVDRKHYFVLEKRSNAIKSNVQVRSLYQFREIQRDKVVKLWQFAKLLKIDYSMKDKSYEEVRRFLEENRQNVLMIGPRWMYNPQTLQYFDAILDQDKIKCWYNASDDERFVRMRDDTFFIVPK